MSPAVANIPCTKYWGAILRMISRWSLFFLFRPPVPQWLLSRRLPAIILLPAPAIRWNKVHRYRSSLRIPYRILRSASWSGRSQNDRSVLRSRPNGIRLQWQKSVKWWHPILRAPRKVPCKSRFTCSHLSVECKDRVIAHGWDELAGSFVNLFQWLNLDFHTCMLVYCFFLKRLFPILQAI